ncbi:MAG TPA: hypothetical protein VM869_06135 [Enhygromyxa sp.]|nr:hypothetical protein [Enhygromyxa sp.]
MRPRSLALVLLLLPLGSCWLIDGDDEGGGGPPCEDDIAGCSDDTSMFMEDPTCTLTGELELELGEGEAEFSSLAAGQLPQLYTGIQGGQHVWMAVRVKNPDLERKQLKIRIKAEYCSESCGEIGSWTVDNLRELVADETTLTTTSDGWLEQTRMLVTVFGWVSASYQRVEMLVTDPCGRQGLVTASNYP